MLDSKETLLKLAKSFAYKPEILEKVYLLLMVLADIINVPYLRTRLVLKGGTALNLFSFDEVPRLSIDIDLNYIGHIDREIMLVERQQINDAISQIFQQRKFVLHIDPKDHAGGKMVWRYASVLGQCGNLEIDMNYMYRQPLWPCVWQKSKLVLGKEFFVPVLDIHEIAAGKLSALFSRNASRDFFDIHCLFTRIKLDSTKLRLAFVVYIAMTTIDISQFNKHKLQYDLFDIKNKLLPVLRQQILPRKQLDLKNWADTLLDQTKEWMSVILPLHLEEQEFIELIRTRGEIRPNLLTTDNSLQQNILNHPAIKWSARKARRL